MAEAATKTAGSAGGGATSAASSAGGATSGLSGTLGNLGSMLPDSLSGLTSKVQGMADQVISPEQRSNLWSKIQKFATEQPKFAAFIFSHIALSGVPLGLFVLMTIVAGLLALVVGLLVGVLGALFFIVSAIGFALVFLLPTLFFTTVVATFLFLFGVGGYYIIKWFNEKKIPGIHQPFGEGMKKELLGTSEVSENTQLPALNPDASKAEGGDGGSGGGDSEEQGEKGAQGSDKKQDTQGRTTQSQQQSGANKAEKRQPHGQNQNGGPAENEKSPANDTTQGASKKNAHPPKIDKQKESA